MLGVCLPATVATTPSASSSPHHLLASVVELGENVDLIRLLQMSWDERLRELPILLSDFGNYADGSYESPQKILALPHLNFYMIDEHGNATSFLRCFQKCMFKRLVRKSKVFQDLTNLLFFLSNSPLGSLVLDDFRRQQFVLVNGRLKLTDLDDLHPHRRPCRHHSQCLVAGQTLADSKARCFNGACFQWNERMNLHRAYVHFGSFLLSHGHPDLLSSHIAKYKERFHSGRVSVPWLRGVTEKLVEAYRSGQHLNRTHGRLPPSAFKTIPNMDASAADSVWCAQRHGCRLTVFDMAEAERACSDDRDCIGFVDNGERSWLNHSIVHLKTKQSRLAPKPGHTLYLRPT